MTLRNPFLDYNFLEIFKNRNLLATKHKPYLTFCVGGCVGDFLKGVQKRTQNQNCAPERRRK